MTDSKSDTKEAKGALKRLVQAALAVDYVVWYARRKGVLLNPTDDEETDQLLVEFHEAVEAVMKLGDKGEGGADAQRR